MRSGINLGKIFGINITVDWSWIFIFLLVTWNLAMGVFPRINPQWGAGLDWILGVIASLLFFASVLSHELAHSLVAESRGLPVKRITLFLFGGVSNIQKEPASPGTEFLMAVVGPLTSLVLGVIFLLLGEFSSGYLLIPSLQNPFRGLSNIGPVATLLLWLGPINILLGIFNLIPGFPLDGGRVLRSILWGITNNLRLATRWATWVGQAIAWIFIVGGIAMIFGLQIPFFGTGFLSGIWLAFIGWFLLNAATQSYQQVVIQDILEGIPVSRLLRTDIHTLSPELLVSDLVDHYIMGTDERSFPVLEGDQLVGLVSLEDVRKVPRKEWEFTRVNQIMTPKADLVTTTPVEEVSDALDDLSRRDIRQMPVLQDGHFIGLIRRQDIIRWLQLQSNSPIHSSTQR